MWNCNHFLVRPLSELQNCGEFRRLRPGAGALQIRFWVTVAKVVLWGSLGCFGPPDGTRIWFWAPVAKVVLFHHTAISKLSISGSQGCLGCFGFHVALKSALGCLSPKCYFSITLLLANRAFRAPGTPWAVLGPQVVRKSGFGRLSPKWHFSIPLLLAT